MYDLHPGSWGQQDLRAAVETLVEQAVALDRVRQRHAVREQVGEFAPVVAQGLQKILDEAPRRAATRAVAEVAVVGFDRRDREDRLGVDADRGERPAEAQAVEGRPRRGR